MESAAPDQIGILNPSQILDIKRMVGAPILNKIERQADTKIHNMSILTRFYITFRSYYFRNIRI